MSRRNKLEKFEELRQFPFVYENFEVTQPQVLDANNQEIQLAGTWNDLRFNNANPIWLELACGRGEYTVGLTQMYPEVNIIGVDIKGARIWKGAREIDRLHISNAAFMRTRIEALGHFFAGEEVSEIWITFPDPFLRESKSNRRLTSDYFLNIYSKILKKGGIVHLKTDDDTLFDFTLETVNARSDYRMIHNFNDIYSLPELPHPALSLKTYYELMHLSNLKTIKYVAFCFDGDQP